MRRNGISVKDISRFNSEVSAVAQEINLLEKGEEISYTDDLFADGLLYDAVINGLEVCGYRCVLGTVVHRWFRRGVDGNLIHGDFRNNVIVLKME